MKVNLKHVEVDGSIFIAGTNYGPKISNDNKAKPPVKMWYDTDNDLTFIEAKGTLWFGKTKGCIAEDPKQFGVEVSSIKPKVVITPPIDLSQYPAMPVAVPIKAQVSGPEIGQNRFNAQVSTPISEPPRKPGRPPKYQGQEKPE